MPQNSFQKDEYAKPVNINCIDRGTMAAADILSNIRVWIIAGIICAFIIGPISDITSTLIIFVLIVQMTLSMEGLSFEKKTLNENKKPILYSVIACFGISTFTALLMGTLFIADHPDIWKGWVMLAAVPCAVSVVTMSFFTKGNTTMCVLSLAVIFFLALILTPLITLMFMGESVSVVKIFSYVVLFVIVPIGMSFPMKKVKISRTTRTVLINIMMFMLVLLSLGQNREYLISEPAIVLLVAAACVIRIFVVSFLMLHLMKKKGSSRNNSMVYIPMAVWKNSGLAVALCIILFSDTAGVVIPCVISLLVEVLWFAVITKYIERTWPSCEGASFSSENA
jgi:BASS family bile acid:Na+ symporter